MDEKWEIDSDSTLLPLIERAGTDPIDITRNGEVIARIMPSPKHDIAKARAAASAIRALSKGMTLGPD